MLRLRAAPLPELGPRHRGAHQSILDDKHPGPIALVQWSPRRLAASWAYFPTRAAAAAHAPADPIKYSIVDLNAPPLPPKLNWPMTGAP